MKRNLQVILACWLTFFQAPEGKEVSYLDLTTPSSSHRKHEPTEGAVNGFSPGYSNSVFRNRVENLSVDLLSLGEHRYELNEDLIYEIRIKNVSPAPLELPWDPDIADVEPKQELQAYQYKVTTLALLFTSIDNQTDTSRAVSLYGTRDKPNSLLRLGSGDWARLRIRVPVIFQSTAFKEAVLASGKKQISVRATLALGQANVTVQNGKYFEAISADVTRSVSTNSKTVEITDPQ